MGTIKKSLIHFLNKKHYFMIKTYSYYRVDIWGFIRLKRLYKYKRILYSIMRYKARFHGLMLYKVYHGIKFFNRKMTYFSNLIFAKKRLKFFYGLLKDKYVGKLGRLSMRGKQRSIDFFYSLLERRIDVLLYRSFFGVTVRHARLRVLSKTVFINDRLVKHYGCLLLVGDVLQIEGRPLHPFFFMYANVRKSSIHFRRSHYLYYGLRRALLANKVFNDNQIKEYFFFLFYKNIPQGKKYSLFVVRLFRKFGRKLFIFGIFLLKKMRRMFYFKRNLYFKFFGKKRFYRFYYKRKKNRRFFLKSYILIFYKYLRFIRLLVLAFRYLRLFMYMLTWKNIVSLSPYLRKNKAHRKLYKTRYFFYRRVVYRIVYNFYTLRYRFKRFFFLLKPLKLLRFKHRWIFRRRLIYKYYIHGRKVRYWRFSKNVFEYLKKSEFFFFVFAGYFAYMEVNYKIAFIILIRHIKSTDIIYPFNVDKFLYFNYFKERGYF